MDDDDISAPERILNQVNSIKKAGYPRQKLFVSTSSVLRHYQNGYIPK